MCRFLKKLLYLVAPVGLLCLTALGVESLVYRNAMHYPDCTIGIIGDSRVQCNVNPEYFPGLANFGQRTSQTMVWKAKLATILAVNPQIKTFIVELSPVNYMRMPNAPVVERAKFTRGHIPSTVLLDLLNTKEMGGLPQSGMARNFILGILWPFAKRSLTFSSKSPLQEGYYPLNRNIRDSWWWKNGCVMKSGAFNVPHDPHTAVKDEVEEILLMLKSRGIKIVLMTAPFSTYEYNGLFMDGEWDFFRSEIRDLCNHYGCKWADYSRSVTEDDLWADVGHLNVKGAECLTRMLKVDNDAGKW